MQRQFLIAVRQGIAGHADLHDVVVELRDLGPPLANLASQQLRMSTSRKDRISIIVDHDSVFAPEQDDRYWRMEYYADGGFQARRPGFDRAKRFDQSWLAISFAVVPPAARNDALWISPITSSIPHRMLTKRFSAPMHRNRSDVQKFHGGRSAARPRRL